MKRKRESETTINHLPEDVLSRIFSHLVDIDLNSTSLVSKQFCSLSSPLLHKLYLCKLRDSSLTYSDFQRLFKRFTGVKQIYIFVCPKLDDVLIAISNSGLNLEKLYLSDVIKAQYQYPEPQTMEIMSTSKVIKSIKSFHLNDAFDHNPGQHQQFLEFINMFPSLIEFDFTYIYILDDNVIHKVTSKFLNLQIVTISNVGMITDKTLDILSSNRPKLEIVDFQGCRKFTPEALYTFFCNNPQLSSVDMPRFYSPSISKVVECMQVLRNLSHISLESNTVQDAVLIALAISRPPLKSLRLGGSGNNYTMGGLIPLLSACPGLEKLNIPLPVSNNNTHDAEMSIAVGRLPKLKHIVVSYHTLVCQATLFSLVQNCPLLEIIWVRSISKAKVKQVFDQGMARPTKKNYSIKLIVIDPKDSNMVLLSTLESYCPNLGK
ncbi:hypothetical protein QQ045_020687 [Rhodiola kirilowii]